MHTVLLTEQGMVQELFVVGHLPLQGRSHVSVRNNKYLKLSIHMNIAEGKAPGHYTLL